MVVALGLVASEGKWKEWDHGSLCLKWFKMQWHNIATASVDYFWNTDNYKAACLTVQKAGKDLHYFPNGCWKSMSCSALLNGESSVNQRDGTLLQQKGEFCTTTPTNATHYNVVQGKKLQMAASPFLIYRNKKKTKQNKTYLLVEKIKSPLTSNSLTFLLPSNTYPPSS